MEEVLDFVGSENVLQNTIYEEEVSMGAEWTRAGLTQSDVFSFLTATVLCHHLLVFLSHMSAIVPSPSPQSLGPQAKFQP